MVETPIKHSSLFDKKLSPTFFAPTDFWSNKENIPLIAESLFHRNLGSISFLDPVPSKGLNVAVTEDTRSGVFKHSLD